MGNDLHIWQQLRTGDPAALEAIFRAHYPDLLRYARRLLPDDLQAEDVVQDVFLRLWQKRTTLPEQVHIKAFVFQALRNAAIDALRKQKRTLPTDSLYAGFDVADDPAPGDDAELLALRKQQLATAWPVLNATEQEILHLRFHDHIPFTEIAGVVGMQYQSVRNAAHRAITKLRKAMG